MVEDMKVEGATPAIEEAAGAGFGLGLEGAGEGGVGAESARTGARTGARPRARLKRLLGGLGGVRLATATLLLLRLLLRLWLRLWLWLWLQLWLRRLLHLQLQVLPGPSGHIGCDHGGLLGGKGTVHDATGVPQGGGAAAKGGDLAGHGEEDPDELLAGEATTSRAGTGRQEVGGGEVGELRGHELPQGVELGGDAEVLPGGVAGGGERGGDICAGMAEVGLEDGSGLGRATGVLGGGGDDRGGDKLGDIVGRLGEGEGVVLGKVL
ncbi:hypothetical protein VM1G_12053 [Cytospora mali]|uniref:Uncharacterized protein n=1 Tax=Cytospora mali TaxID=578113 RepID=A0A194VJH9_CYTMA|nr:hypothetical protein VM1G_12053 [Valsa mali]